MRNGAIKSYFMSRANKRPQLRDPYASPLPRLLAVAQNDSLIWNDVRVPSLNPSEHDALPSTTVNCVVDSDAAPHRTAPELLKWEDACEAAYQPL